MKITENSPLLRHNTFGMDVKAARMVEFDTEQELQEILTGPCDRVLTIGAGSNLLFLNDFCGTILHSCIKYIDVVSDEPDAVLVRVGSGVNWDSFVAWTVRNGFWGAENLSSIPGEVGASAVQNIGAYGAEAKDIIKEVRVVSIEDGSVRVFRNEECQYGYRQSIFKNELKGKYVVTAVTYCLSKKESPKLGYGALQERVKSLGAVTQSNIRLAVAQIRKEKLPDPAVLGNAGSFFMNPVISTELFERIRSEYPEIPSYVAPQGFVKIPAGWLIEKSGWKGQSLGPAAVHDRQALVLINKGGATGADIKKLADTIIADVKRKFDVQLCAEVNYIE